MERCFNDEHLYLGTRKLVKRPYEILSAVGTPENQSEFVHELVGLTPFQDYRIEVSAETLLGISNPGISKEKVHYVTAELLSFVYASHFDWVCQCFPVGRTKRSDAAILVRCGWSILV